LKGTLADVMRGKRLRVRPQRRRNDSVRELLKEIEEYSVFDREQ